MKEYIALDTRKYYSVVEREGAQSQRAVQGRIEHAPGAIRAYLKRCEPGTVVAVEATGNWHWIAQEIEEARMVPALVHPRKAKLMMGMINKTDKLDAHGLNRLPRNQTLPTVWIPPAPLRDQRELTRTRMVLVRQRTRLKNRILATLNKYGLVLPEEVSDAYGARARQELNRRVEQLPPQTRYVTEALLRQLDFVQTRIDEMEERLQALLTVTPAMDLLMSLPGIGLILGAAAALEIGAVARHLAEAAFYVLSKNEPYREPALKGGASTQG